MTERPPRAGVVEVLWCDLSALAGEADALAVELGPEERDRAARFRFARDRDLFVLRRAWRRRRLGEVLGLPPARVRFDPAPGRPRLLGAALQISTACSAGVAVLALHPTEPLGVDLETHDPALLDGGRDASRRSDAPFALLGLSGPVGVAALFDRWAEVEARAKLRGDGLPGFDPAEPPRAGEHLTPLSIRPGFSAALATPAPPDGVTIREAAL